MHSHPAYALMVAIAEKAGRPTTFPNDLYVHDSRTLDMWNANIPFVWALAESATVLIRTDIRNGDTSDSKALAQTMAHYCGQTSMLFHWDGSQLVEITETKLTNLLMGRKVSTDRQALSY